MKSRCGLRRIRGNHHRQARKSAQRGVIFQRVVRRSAMTVLESIPIPTMRTGSWCRTGPFAYEFERAAARQK